MAQRRRGQPQFEPTADQREQVRVMRANGDCLQIIAGDIGISVPTLRRAFREELETGHARILRAIASVVVRAAMAGNIQACRNWLSTNGGPTWRVTEQPPP